MAVILFAKRSQSDNGSILQCRVCRLSSEESRLTEPLFLRSQAVGYAIDVAMELSTAQQEMLVEIIRRRHVDARRREMADDAQTSLGAFRSGALKPQSAVTIIRELHQELDE